VYLFVDNWPKCTYNETDAHFHRHRLDGGPVAAATITQWAVDVVLLIWPRHHQFPSVYLIPGGYVYQHSPHSQPAINYSMDYI